MCLCCAGAPRWSVVILDEFEKIKHMDDAHRWGQSKKIYLQFLEVFENGTISDPAYKGENSYGCVALTALRCSPETHKTSCQPT